MAGLAKMFGMGGGGMPSPEMLAQLKDKLPPGTPAAEHAGRCRGGRAGMPPAGTGIPAAPGLPGSRE